MQLFSAQKCGTDLNWGIKNVLEEMDFVRNNEHLMVKCYLFDVRK